MSRQTQAMEEVRALNALGLQSLREIWRARYGAPPPLRSPDLLRRILAWRVQAEAFGGLDSETQRALKSNTQPRGLAAGTRLVREWRGVRHEVEVADSGYIYEGERWTSLSEIARAITGTRWNGPRFFGLRSDDGK